MQIYKCFRCYRSFCNSQLLTFQMLQLLESKDVVFLYLSKLQEKLRMHLWINKQLNYRS